MSYGYRLHQEDILVTEKRKILSNVLPDFGVTQSSNEQLVCLDI